MQYYCELCQKPVLDYEPIYCCNGWQCGCHGMPQEPCICSNRCWDALMDGEGSLTDRRQQAGIELFNPKQKMLFDDK